jgi:hypothetical protein
MGTKDYTAGRAYGILIVTSIDIGVVKVQTS